MNARSMHYSLAACIILVCTGCWPYHFTNKPGASGTVVDAESKSPIVGASVTLRISAREKNDQVVTETEADGRFLFKPQKEWSIYIVPMDYFPIKSVITISSKGYLDVNKEFRWSMVGPSIADIGIIELQRLKQD